jgi:hypothetical protein
MPFRDIFFGLFSNIIIFPIWVTRIAAVGDIESDQNFTDIAILKSSFIQQKFNVRGGTHATNHLKT